MYTKELYHNYLRRHEEYHAWRNSTFYSTMAKALKEEGPEKERLLDELLQQDEDKRPGVDTARNNWLGGYDITYSPSEMADGRWKPIKESTVKVRQQTLAEWKDDWEAKKK